jgi:hypothetical protein
LPLIGIAFGYSKESFVTEPRLMDYVLARSRVDLQPSGAPPPLRRLSTVTLLCVICSLAADAGLIRLGGVLFPAIQSYSHFHPFDYGTLTVLGVIAACASWPMAIRISSVPRSFFLRLAIFVTTLLLVPDAWLLLGHETAKGVLVLVAMHFSIALITYNFLVHLAPARTVIVNRRDTEANESTPPERELSVESAEKITKPDLNHERILRLVMMWAVAVEFLTGLVSIVYVPIDRPDGWFATRGESLYLAHAILGGLLALGVVTMLTRTSRLDRRSWIAAVVGGSGVFLSAVGGVMCVEHPLRLFGMALMFLGSSVAFFAYLTPSLASAPMPPPGWNNSEDA